MSLEENKELVRRIYDELWNERKLEVAEELIAQDAVNYDTGLLPQPFGPEEMKGTVRMVTAGFPDNRHEVQEMIAEGDKVVVRCTLTGTHEGEFMGIPPTGKPIEMRGIAILRIADGRIVENWGMPDMLGLMQQLGVVPTPKQTTE